MSSQNKLYDASSELEQVFGAVGSDSWNRSLDKAWEEYNAQVLLDARKGARMTQTEVAQKTGTTKSYISRVEHGAIVPTVVSFYRILHACGMRVVISRAADSL